MKKLKNYVANLEVLQYAKDENLENEFIIGGIIDKFSMQFELGWKVLKELLKYEGCAVANSGSPREIIKEAYKVYDFIDEDIWLEMLKDRNDTSHVCDGAQAKRLVQKILDKYIPTFILMRDEIKERYADVLEQQ